MLLTIDEVNKLVILKNYDLQGERFKIFFDKCCKGDKSLFLISFLLLENNLYSKEEFDNNLNNLEQIPIVNILLVSKYFKNVPIHLIPVHCNFKMFCIEQYDVFIKTSNYLGKRKKFI